jgi:hypothetical protein
MARWQHRVFFRVEEERFANRLFVFLWAEGQ